MIGPPQGTAQCPPHPKLWAGIKILEKFAVGGGGTESTVCLGGSDFGWEIKNSQISVGGTQKFDQKNLFSN